MPRARRRPRPPVHPDAIIRAYFGELLAMAEWCRHYTETQVKPVLAALLEEHERSILADKRDGLHVDRAPPLERLNELIAEGKRQFLEYFPAWRTQRLLKRYATRTEQHQKIQLQKQIKDVIGIPLGKVIDNGLTKATAEFTATNVALISTIPEQYFSQVQTTILDGVKDGKRAKELASDIEDRFEVTKSRAYLIARDQIGKFNGDLDRVRQTNLGVKEFVWHTLEDEKVRDSHAELDGGTYSWDDPPDGDDPDATPGSEINCRCWSEAVLDE